MVLALSLFAIALGMVMVLADDRIGRRAARGPEAGAVMARMLGFVLMVSGGVTFLAWAR